MPISPPAYQLKFDLDLPEEESNSALSAEEINLREEAARKAFENGESFPKDENGKPIAPYNLALYISMRIGRWPFRVAALIMWLATPRKYRWPKTQDELANLLGMGSDRQFSVWRSKNPSIDLMMAEAWKKNAVERLPDSLEAMYEVAATPDYKGKGDRELHYKLAEILQDHSTINLNAASGDADDVLKNIPFAKLLELAGVNTPERIAEFKAKIAREHTEQVRVEEEARKDASE